MINETYGLEHIHTNFSLHTCVQHYVKDILAMESSLWREQ